MHVGFGAPQSGFEDPFHDWHVTQLRGVAR